MNSVASSSSLPTRPIQPKEPPIAFADLPAWFQREYGIRPHASTIYRWLQRGSRGVKFPSFVIGGRRYADPAAVRQFIAEINADAA
jgi:hypothetical protein